MITSSFTTTTTATPGYVVHVLGDFTPLTLPGSSGYVEPSTREFSEQLQWLEDNCPDVARVSYSYDRTSLAIRSIMCVMFPLSAKDVALLFKLTWGNI